MIVTIDGPAGSGKSTVAKMLAERLEFRFLDTGAMYRAVAYACQLDEVDLTDTSAVGKLAAEMKIEFEGDQVFLDGKNVTEFLRTPEVTQSASVVAVNATVRHSVTELQRQFATGQNIVTEGRDQGTVVFPDARCKFFLTADPRERAVRRQRDLESQGTVLPFEVVLAQLLERDKRDEQRQLSPLKPSDDAVMIDTSTKTAEAVLMEMERTVRERQPDV